MGHRSRLLAASALLFSVALAVGCRQGPYPVATPTPALTKTFPVVAEDLTKALPDGASARTDTAAAPAVFNANCLGCHAETGGLGPSLKNPGGKSNLEAFVKVVRSGRGMMPAYQTDKISDADLAGMWEYLSGAVAATAQPSTGTAVEKPQPAAGKPAVPEPARTQPVEVATGAGQKLFEQQCNACHPGGGAGMGPSLKGGKLTLPSFSQVVRGGKGIMPGYQADKIGDGDLEAMWNYLKDLK